MNTVQVKLPRWIGSYGVPLAPWPGAANAAKPSAEAAAKGMQLNAEESARFVRIVAECGRIRRHYDLFRWLGGELQHFLPHDALLSAWGDFDSGELKLDVTSGLPGVRTAQLAHCRVAPLVREAYGRWVEAGRQPVLLKPADIESEYRCHCALHVALRGMQALIVHGVHDKRSSRDSLFIAMSGGPFAKGRSMTRFISVLDPLIAQIDAAFRKVPAMRLPACSSPSSEGSNVLDLSARELEVLESICRGRTNLAIASALDISPFTVKNHVQRIFRKIGVTNRTQAAARYAEALRRSTSAGDAGQGEPAAQTA